MKPEKLNVESTRMSAISTTFKSGAAAQSSIQRFPLIYLLSNMRQHTGEAQHCEELFKNNNKYVCLIAVEWF